jgi:hypothetical protein
MLLLVARQESERPFSMESVPRPLLGNHSVNTPSQQHGGRCDFCVVRAEELSWRPSALTVQFRRECSGVQVSGWQSSKRIEIRSTVEYKRPACEDVLCELEGFMCVIVQGELGMRNPVRLE